MGEINKIPAGKFLYESGLLFEINRTVLHPFGLALEVNVDNETGEVTLGDLWDYRDDPEGMLYGEGQIRVGMEKYTKFMEEFGDEKINERLKYVGFVIQDTGDY